MQGSQSFTKKFHNQKVLWIFMLPIPMVDKYEVMLCACELSVTSEAKKKKKVTVKLF